ncbi:nucleotide exchange factor GrpE [Subtercola endophyticus]|uniref:nucleotide exchange factor GrpE n=1 Tax=Subtercola endophyticus TaxID=2895559 RepID=UPI001E45266F|nr:nucleotide exchange factor GrpE [Subtercola endophyticus]UFS58227.1 nucleotide exchange factor GrpE [Subtercola endophyticus]
MAEDESKHGGNNHGDEESDGLQNPTGSGADATDPVTGESVSDAEFIEAEGPDVETHTAEDDDEGYSEAAGEGETVGEGELNDDDLSFLEAVSAGETQDSDLAAERLADLQRVTAEYANYRKRTEANREIERERTVGEVVKVLLPVLDDFDRAEKHGDLAEGPFVSIVAKLRVGVERFGLTPFGAKGDMFDPQIHEAIFQQPSADVQIETVADVVETGYYLGSSLLRAAKVVVAVPNG